MKTIILHVPNEADEATVLAALRELQQKTPFYLESDTGQLPGCDWSAEEVKAEILRARQGVGVSLAEARQRFNI